MATSELGGFDEGDGEAWKGDPDDDEGDTEELLGPPREWLPDDDPVLHSRVKQDHELTWVEFKHAYGTVLPAKLGGGYELNGDWELEDEATTLTIRGYVRFEGDLCIDMLRILPGGLLHVVRGRVGCHRAALYNGGSIQGGLIGRWALWKERLKRWRIRRKFKNGTWPRAGEGGSAIRRFCAPPARSSGSSSEASKLPPSPSPS